MNTSKNQPMESEPNNEGVPRELMAVEQGLAKLAASEATGAHAGIEDRVFSASRAAISPLPHDLAEVGDRVDRLAASDHGAGSPQLELQAFELSREAVASGRYVEPVVASGGPALRLGEGTGERGVVVRTRWVGRAFRVAAAVAVCGAGAAVWLRSGAPDTTMLAAKPSTEQIERTIASEMENLYEAMDGAGAGYQAASNEDADADAAWIEELFDKESL